MKLLRHALEAEQVASTEPAEGKQAEIQMKGPLADVYAQALNVAYAKAPDDESPLQVPVETPNASAVQTVLESQQMDVTMLQELSKLVNPSNGAGVDVPKEVVYAVSDQGVSEDDVIEVARDLVATPPGERGEGDFILIVDGTMPGPNGETAGSEPQERMRQLGVGLEALVTSFGGKVYHSFGEYLQARAVKS